MLVYWLMLVGGMALFTANRMQDAAALQGIWLALLIGTAVGHALAVVNMRTAAAFISILLAGCWFVAIFPPDVTGSAFARTFVAAGLCAFWSLGDRSSLAAFWFPTMIWMLSILDRTGANAMPDRIGIVLLGGLAIAFVLFLRAREARRIELWRTVGFTALATPKPAIVLKEHPGGRLARASWSLFVASVAFGVTAWLAPQLWHVEGVAGDPVTIRFPDSGGLPCCPVSYTQTTTRTRVKEYLDLGRGHDEVDPDPPPLRGSECRVCGGTAVTVDGTMLYGDVPMVASGGGLPVETVPYVDGYTPSTGTTTSVTTSAPDIAETSSAPGVPQTVEPVPSVAPPPVPPPSYTPPSVTPEPPPPPPPASEVTPPSPPPTAAVQAPPPPPSSSPMASEPASNIPPQRDLSLGASLLRWLLLAAGCVLVLQIVALVLRPLRRMITLRHLRRPFWTESVDQRVSNSWQLALVGLRDAGWRSSSGESPRELAHRVGVEGLERCATILERARHGLGVDAGDLADMSASADAAYRSAREKLGPVARASAQLRWPLA
jgi:hypothetical protein